MYFDHTHSYSSTFSQLLPDPLSRNDLPKASLLKRTVSPSASYQMPRAPQIGVGCPAQLPSPSWVVSALSLCRTCVFCHNHCEFTGKCPAVSRRHSFFVVSHPWPLSLTTSLILLHSGPRVLGGEYTIWISHLGLSTPVSYYILYYILYNCILPVMCLCANHHLDTNFCNCLEFAFFIFLKVLLIKSFPFIIIKFVNIFLFEINIFVHFPS